MRYGVLVCGPAGSGKSTFSAALIAAAQQAGRSVHLFNLDPAAERFGYEPAVDIRELITVEDVMEEMGLGPNGALVACLDYVLSHPEWLHDQLAPYEDDYLIIDCPGQIELYTHAPLMPRLAELLQNQLGFRLAAAYLLEAQFMDDTPKYFAGVLGAAAAMVHIGLPHVNLMSKMDLLKRPGAQKRTRSEIDRFLDPDPLLLADMPAGRAEGPGGNSKFAALNHAVAQLVSDFSLVSFLPLDATDDENVTDILSHIDNAVQYGEDEEPREPKDLDEGDYDEAADEFEPDYV